LVGGIDQTRLDALFTAALEAAIARIEKDGTFFPLVFELRANGVIQNVAVLDTGATEGAQKVIDRLVQVLRPRAAGQTIQAAAIVLFRSAEPAIEVRLRAANYSRDVTAPFTLATSGVFRRRRKLTLGEFTTREAANELF